MGKFHDITPKTASALIFLAAAATLAGAWGFELIGNVVPCPLCLLERLPYYGAVALAAFGFMAGRAHRNGIATIVLALMLAGFLWNAGLGAYHSGAEWKWWPGPDTCAGGGFETNAARLLATLDQVITPRCDEASLRIFGLSLAGYNVLISLALTGIAAMGISNYAKSRNSTQGSSSVSQ